MLHKIISNHMETPHQCNVSFNFQTGMNSDDDDCISPMQSKALLTSEFILTLRSVPTKVILGFLQIIGCPAEGIALVPQSNVIYVKAGMSLFYSTSLCLRAHKPLTFEKLLKYFNISKN